MYAKFKNQLDLVLSYIQQLSTLELDTEDRAQIRPLRERAIGLSGACKSIENIRENIHTLRDALDPNLKKIYYELMDMVIRLNKSIYHHIGRTPIKNAEDIDTVIDDMRNYRNNILNHVAPYVINGNVGDMDLSSLVNLTTELTESMKNMSHVQ
jgi:hypothetical protein